MTKPKFPIPEGMELCPVPPKVSPPEGIGRPKGSQNKSTVAIKEAMAAVYRILQEDAGGDHGHLKAWAEANPGQFYRLWMRLLPHQTDANMDGAIIGTVVFVKDYV